MSLFIIANCNNLETCFNKVKRKTKKTHCNVYAKKTESRENERNVTNNAVQSMCSESVTIFCPTYEGPFFANKTIKHLFTLDFEKFLFPKIVILRKMGIFFVSFLYIVDARRKKVNIK